jgi:hypothetical protein
MSETCILIRLLQRYFPRNWEFGSVLLKLRNFTSVRQCRITHHYGNSKVHYHVHKIIQVLCLINRLHSLTPHSFRIHNFSLPSTSPDGNFPFCFKTKIVYAMHISPTCATCPAYLTHLDLMALMISRKEFKLWIFPFHLLAFPWTVTSPHVLGLKLCLYYTFHQTCATFPA